MWGKKESKAVYRGSASEKNPQVNGKGGPRGLGWAGGGVGLTESKDARHEETCCESGLQQEG